MPVFIWREEISIPHISIHKQILCLFFICKYLQKTKKYREKRDDKEDRVDNASALFRMAVVKVKFRI